MPPDQDLSSQRTGEGANMVIPPLTSAQFSKLVEKVLEMLLLDLKLERERIGASPGFQRRKGVR